MRLAFRSFQRVCSSAIYRGPILLFPSAVLTVMSEVLYFCVYAHTYIYRTCSSLKRCRQLLKQPDRSSKQASEHLAATSHMHEFAAAAGCTIIVKQVGIYVYEAGGFQPAYVRTYVLPLLRFFQLKRGGKKKLKDRSFS